MLDTVHHVAIICSNYERSRRFFAEILGLPIIREVWREDRQSWKCDLQVGANPDRTLLVSEPSGTAIAGRRRRGCAISHSRLLLSSQSLSTCKATTSLSSRSGSTSIRANASPSSPILTVFPWSSMSDSGVLASDEKPL